MTSLCSVGPAERTCEKQRDGEPQSGCTQVSDDFTDALLKCLSIAGCIFGPDSIEFPLFYTGSMQIAVFRRSGFVMDKTLK